MEYKIAYIVNKDFSAFNLLFYVLFTVFFGYVIFQTKEKMNIFKKILLVFVTSVIFLVASFAFISKNINMSKYVSWLNSGDYSVTEGYVENFDPAPTGGHKYESFTVNGNVFKYSDYDMTGTFHQTRSHGGPIYPGRWVRLCYRNGLILKIAVKE